MSHKKHDDKPAPEGEVQAGINPSTGSTTPVLPGDPITAELAAVPPGETAAEPGSALAGDIDQTDTADAGVNDDEPKPKPKANHPHDAGHKPKHKPA